MAGWVVAEDGEDWTLTRGAEGAAGECAVQCRRSAAGDEGIRAMERGQHVAAANESRPKPKDGCSVVFFRRKQDAVQERHCTLSDCCLLLDRLLGIPGTLLNGPASPRRQRKVQPSPAQPGRSRGESSRVESGRVEVEESRVGWLPRSASTLDSDPRALT